tara:strand:+ start:285 stop:1184 length:900 start_codon:yes stop_codon:yes gene_type:complete
MNNFFDNIQININKLFEDKNTKKNITDLRRNIFLKFIVRYAVAILYKFGFYERLINAGIILGWFNEFKEYWSSQLKGRPIYINDFYFLLGIYRVKYQELSVEKNSSEQSFLESWQDNNSIYQLFGAVRRFSREPIYCYRYERWINSGDKILEYGCGIAPLANSLLKYSIKSKLSIAIADIKQINSHFAKWRLSNTVKYIDLLPYKKNITDKYDKIFLITVMEHLPNPLEVIMELKNSLNDNGLIIFDYILSEGTGLDTKEALDQRNDVLDYINDNFVITYGTLNKNQSMGTTVIKKKNI